MAMGDISFIGRVPVNVAFFEMYATEYSEQQRQSASWPTGKAIWKHQT